MKVELAERYYRNLGDWSNTIKFYLYEMTVFQKRLNMVIKANTSKDLLAKVEHFQNQFILQKEQFEILQHDINEEKMKLRADILGKGPVINVAPTKKNHVVEEKMESAEKIFRDTKTEFHRFLSEVL